MSPLFVSRVLFILLIANEAYVAFRTTADELREINVPPITGLSCILLLAPWAIVLPLPDWLGWLAVTLQLLGLVIEIAAETQLMRADSFAASSGAGKNIQTNGMYRWLENPIYGGILLQLVAWAFWMPVALISILLLYLLVRQMVARERTHLASLSVTHRGVDSLLWN